jgi:hypothetical protein
MNHARLLTQELTRVLPQNQEVGSRKPDDSRSFGRVKFAAQHVDEDFFMNEQRPAAARRNSTAPPENFE